MNNNNNNAKWYLLVLHLRFHKINEELQQEKKYRLKITLTEALKNFIPKVKNTIEKAKRAINIIYTPNATSANMSRYPIKFLSTTNINLRGTYELKSLRS